MRDQTMYSLFGGKRILLVEDDPRLREAVRLLLYLEGCQVTEADNGRRACLLFTPGDFDLVIADYSMPEMNGDELAGTIKCLTPSQPILMMVAKNEQLLSRGSRVDLLIEKPFKMAELRQVVAALLASQQSGPSPSAQARPLARP
jgi:DNA-binding response OmpR family regulator